MEKNQGRFILLWNVINGEIALDTEKKVERFLRVVFDTNNPTKYAKENVGDILLLMELMKQPKSNRLRINYQDLCELLFGWHPTETTEIYDWAIDIGYITLPTPEEYNRLRKKETAVMN